MKDQIININLPLCGYSLCPGYNSGQMGLPIEIYVSLYLFNDSESIAITGPDELSSFVSTIDDEDSAWRFLRLFTALNTHYYFQKDIYTIDLGVSGTDSVFGTVLLSEDVANEIGYKPPTILFEGGEYIAARDLIQADPTGSSVEASIIRRKESISKDAGYRFIEDQIKGSIERKYVSFPSYE